MILITPEQETTRLDAERDRISAILVQLGKTLEDLNTQVAAGEVSDKTEANRVLADIRYWLKAARETEAELDQIRRKTAGICAAYGLDLEAAELEIGCRMARLRTCCREDELSG
ncbi:hypothetical protein [Aestuariicoccus sp. MJ-SS9]|uniref:hypothetical protein n=1 Tax=Aestuariicoccus sp. MJ-SS9 TaxID=3079855 RepID=UPI00290AC014|nr:hypothetical protein [Aestuariicoccus sp. MJ-SS9]MDU8911077.1 hypothetical protein [Aestuariicoccus sp. MJ-SS9]